MGAPQGNLRYLYQRDAYLRQAARSLQREEELEKQCEAHRCLVDELVLNDRLYIWQVYRELTKPGIPARLSRCANNATHDESLEAIRKRGIFA